jgi:hypothetical protein
MIMGKFRCTLATAFALFLASPDRSGAQEKEPLRLVQTIPMPNVKGRLDHMES